jgi:hypothetical protein
VVGGLFLVATYSVPVCMPSTANARWAPSHWQVIIVQCATPPSAVLSMIGSCFLICRKLLAQWKKRRRAVGSGHCSPSYWTKSKRSMFYYRFSTRTYWYTSYSGGRSEGSSDKFHLWTKSKNANLAPFSPYSPLFGEPVFKASNTTGAEQEPA